MCLVLGIGTGEASYFAAALVILALGRESK
jgi:hypothetical protein